MCSSRWGTGNVDDWKYFLLFCRNVGPKAGSDLNCIINWKKDKREGECGAEACGRGVMAICAHGCYRSYTLEVCDRNKWNNGKCGSSKVQLKKLESPFLLSAALVK